MKKPRGADRTKQIYDLLALPEDSLNDKARKLDKINDKFIEIRKDLFFLHERIDEQGESPKSEPEKDWLQKATFARDKMFEDHGRLEANRKRLIDSITAISPEHEILSTCTNLEKELQKFINALAEPKPVRKSKIEIDYPSDVMISDLDDEFGSEDLVNLFIEEDEEDLMNSMAETEEHRNMYDAFFVAHAKKQLGEEVFEKIAELADTSYSVYAEKHSG